MSGGGGTRGGETGNLHPTQIDGPSPCPGDFSAVSVNIKDHMVQNVQFTGSELAHRYKIGMRDRRKNHSDYNTVKAQRIQTMGLRLLTLLRFHLEDFGNTMAFD